MKMNAEQSRRGKMHSSRAIQMHLLFVRIFIRRFVRTFDDESWLRTTTKFKALNQCAAHRRRPHVVIVSLSRTMKRILRFESIIFTSTVTERTTWAVGNANARKWKLKSNNNHNKWTRIQINAFIEPRTSDEHRWNAIELNKSSWHEQR